MGLQPPFRGLVLEHGRGLHPCTGVCEGYYIYRVLVFLSTPLNSTEAMDMVESIDSIDFVACHPPPGEVGRASCRERV